MQRHISQLPSSNGASAFARYFPRTEEWVRKRRLIREFSEESKACAREAAVWEGRGHWEMAGKLYERGAGLLLSSMDMQYDSGRRMEMEGMLRSAMVSYRLELSDAARYDPSVHWRMYRVARSMGNASAAAMHFKKSCDGFSLMVGNTNVDNLVRLNRLKRKFIEEVWDGTEDARLKTAAEAIAASKRIMTADGKVTREEDTRRWLVQCHSERFGGHPPFEAL